MKKVFIIIFLLAAALPAPSQAPWDAVQKILGRKGTIEGSLFKVVYPRTDLDVKIGDVPVDPRVGLTSWVAFGANQPSMVMGDLVLKVEEVAPVIRKLAAEKMDITALHNHLMGTSVPLMNLHFSGSGDAAKLANSVKAVLSATGTPVGETSRPPETIPSEFGVVQYYLGPGTQQGAVLKYNFPRNQTIIEDDREIPGFLGTDTSLSFESFGGKVGASGDFVLTADEVNTVVKTLADNNIAVTGIHSHLLTETPRLFFVHFWGYDVPQAVASGLKAALDKINIRRQPE